MQNPFILPGGSSGPLFPYFNSYLTQLREQGYARRSFFEQIHILKTCDRWLQRTGRGVHDLNECVVREFLRRCIPGAYGKHAKVATMRRLLTMLRRMGEAISLQPQDVDLSAGVLTVRGAKFGKSRLVPLHPSTQAVLRDYAQRRDRFFAGRPIPYFLMTGRGKKLHKTSLSSIFRALSRQIGIRKPGRRRGPRLHDFRHGFAIRTLLRWYRSGQDVDRRMPVLSTYLGHGHVSGTYWYLGSTPELITAASKLIETRWKGVA